MKKMKKEKLLMIKVKKNQELKNKKKNTKYTV